MIYFIKGELVLADEGLIVVESSSIGWEIAISSNVATRLPPQGSTVKIYTHLHLKEDGISLYGFLTQDELAMFRLLITVNGVGPRAALAILSVLTPDELRFAILSGDDKSITKAPGLGKKTAQKVILELKDRMNIKDVMESSGADSAMPQPPAGDDTLQDAKTDAIKALTALGYTTAEAFAAVNRAASDSGMNAEDILDRAIMSLIK